jgi:hypothetical protein
MESYEVELSAEVHADVKACADDSDQSVQEVVEAAIRFAFANGFDPKADNALPKPAPQPGAEPKDVA